MAFPLPSFFISGYDSANSEQRLLENEEHRFRYGPALFFKVSGWPFSYGFSQAAVRNKPNPLRSIYPGECNISQHREERSDTSKKKREGNSLEEIANHSLVGFTSKIHARIN